MRSPIVRTVVAPLALCAVALVVGRAEANAPPVSCQTQAPHHTATLGAGVDSVSLSSKFAYWNNECGCYIAQIDVPSTSSPQSSTLTKSFDFGQIGPWVDLPKAECSSYKERTFVYKKENGAFALKSSHVETGSWVAGHDGNPGVCAVKPTVIGGYNPPASGSDTYRVLRSVEWGGQFRATGVTARHVAAPPPPPR